MTNEEPVDFCSSCPFAGCPNCAYQVPCDGCGESTTDPTDCDHGKTLCPECVHHYTCLLCGNDAQYEARLGI